MLLLHIWTFPTVGSVRRRIASPSGVKDVQHFTSGYTKAKTRQIQENIEAMFDK